MQNPAFWCILDSENGQLLTGKDPEGTARGRRLGGERGNAESIDVQDAKGAENVESGVENGEGIHPNRLRSLGKCRELPQRCPGRSPGRKRISVLSKRHICISLRCMS